jgi:glycosyltransferase involved in cell wall biosynthesis
VTLVSAIIPTYNRNELLFDRSLPSVLRQTHQEMEILIVADGMVGETFDNLEARIAGLGDPRVKLANIERPTYPEDPGLLWSVQGIYARNFGLDHAKGEWIAALDDDDEWTDDHVEILLGAAIEKGVDFAYGRAVTPWGQRYGFWPPSGMNFTDGSQLYRHDMGYRYDPDCVLRWLPADADLWNRMVAGGVTFTFVDELVHRYFPAPR